MAGLNRVTPGTGITSAWGNTTSAKTIRNFTSLVAATTAIAAAGITPEAGEVIYCADVDQLYRYRAGTWYAHGAANAARAYANATTALAAAAMTDVALQAESYDYGGRFAASRYTVPYTGLYDVRFRVSMAVPGVVELFGLVRSGTTTEHCRSSRTITPGGVSNPSVVGADVVMLTAGAQIKLSAYVNAAGCNISAATDAETFLAIRPAA